MGDMIKVRILRGTTIADPPVFKPGEGDPPTFATGDVVEVSRALAQQLVGNNKAEYFKGPPLIERAPYEEQGEGEEEPAALTTAALAPAENAMQPAAPKRTAGGKFAKKG